MDCTPMKLFILFKLVFVFFYFNQALADSVLEEHYTLQEIPMAVARINGESSEEEQMRNSSTYGEFRYKDSRLPPYSVILKLYTEQHGNAKGLTDFVFPERNKKRDFYRLGEVPLAVASINAQSSEREWMFSGATYTKFRYKDPKLPPWTTLLFWYKKEHGNSKGFSAFIFSEQTRKSKFHRLEEVPLAVASINAQSSEREWMVSRATYTKFRYKDPKLPSWVTLVNWYKKEHGHSKGLSNYLFPQQRRVYTLEEIPLAIMRVIMKFSEDDIFKGVYEALRSKDSKLPVWDTFIRDYQQKYGDEQDLSVVASSKRCENSMAQW